MPVKMVAGLPWYIWGFTIMGFAMLLIIGLFIFYWWSMGPCRDYFQAQLHNEDLTLFMQKNGKLSMKGVDYVEKIFNSKDMPLSWIQRSDESFRFGKCMSKLVCDVNGICTEPTINQAIKEFVYEWNETELNREAWYNNTVRIDEDGNPVDESGNPVSYYQADLILDYKDLVEKIKEGRVDDPLVLPAVFEVPVWEVERYLLPVGPGDLEGHVAVRVMEETEQADTEAWPGWMKAFIAIEIGIVIIAVIAYMLGGK